MPVSFIFRCQYCDAQPDPLTQMRLQGAMREFVWGAYQNALPDETLSCVLVRSGQEPVVVNLDLPDVADEPERVRWVDDIHS